MDGPLYGLIRWSAGPLPRTKFHVYRSNVSPLRGEKPIFGPLSKNNTGMAVLRTGLPVINLLTGALIKSAEQRAII